MLSKLGFEFIYSNVEPMTQEPLPVHDFRQYFNLSLGMARIIYCDHSQLEEVRQLASECSPGIVQKLNPTTREDLHDNDETSLIIVTEERLMRGFDYRAYYTGFALLIAKELDCYRSYLQALGRAGRIGEPAKKFKLDAVGSGYVEEGSRTSLKVLRNYRM